MRGNSTFKISLLIGLFIGAIVGGFAIFFFVIDREQSNDSHTTALPFDTSERSVIQSSPMTSQTEQQAKDALTVSVRSLMEISSLGSDFEQSLALYTLLANADEAGLERYIAQALSISSTNQRNAALSIIYGRYAAINPTKALERALAMVQLSVQEKALLVRSIFNEWTVGDIEGAVAAIESLPPQFKVAAASAVMWRSDDLPLDQRQRLAERIGPSDAWTANVVNSMRGEAFRLNPRAAFYDRIRETATSNESFSDLMHIALYWFESEGVDVLTAIAESPLIPNFKTQMLNNLIWSSIQGNRATPESVLRVVSEFINSEDARKATEYTFRTWSRMDAREAFEVSLEYDSQLVSQHLRSTLLQLWTSVDPDGVLKEVSSIPATFRGTATVQALGRISINSPLEAIRIARDLDAQTLRIKARDEIVRNWSSVDAESAFAWLINDEFSDGSQSIERTWHPIFRSYLDQDFESARSFAHEYEGKLQSDLLVAVARRLVRQDIEDALDYLPMIDEEDRFIVENEIGMKLVSNDPEQALSFGETVPEERKESYYDSMLNSWADEDGNALYSNIKRVPRKYQVTAAREILYANRRQSFLSDRQVSEMEALIEAEQDTRKSASVIFESGRIHQQ